MQNSGMIAKLITGAVISIVLLSVLFLKVDFTATLHAILSANFPLLATAAVVHILWLLLRAQAWRSLLAGRCMYADAFITLCEGYLLNALLPFRLGEVGRVYLLSQKTRASFMVILPSVLVERVFDVIISFVLLLALLPMVMTQSTVINRQTMIGVLLLLTITIFLSAWGLKKRDMFIGLYKKITSPWPRLRESGVKAIISIFEGFDFLSPKHIGYFLILILLAWMIDIYLFYLIVLSLFPEATLLWGGFVLVATAWGAAIPSLPGGVGTLEASVTGAVVLLAGEEALSTALALGLIIRLFMYLFSGSVGVYGLLQENDSIYNIYTRLKTV